MFYGTYGILHSLLLVMWHFAHYSVIELLLQGPEMLCVCCVVLGSSLLLGVSKRYVFACRGDLVGELSCFCVLLGGGYSP